MGTGLAQNQRPASHVVRICLKHPNQIAYKQIVQKE